MKKRTVISRANLPTSMNWSFTLCILLLNEKFHFPWWADVVAIILIIGYAVLIAYHEDEVDIFEDDEDEVVNEFKEIDSKANPEPETPQICYKTNEVCKYDCKGLCRESM